MESSFHQLMLIPARIILADPDILPDAEGVYYFLLAGGTKLLRASNYFKFYDREPLSHRDDVHLYTGASVRLRSRIMCHLVGGADQSGLRKTLVALEFARSAISKTQTPSCHISDRQGLNRWLARNASIAYVPCPNARERERRLLTRLISPLNLQGSHNPKYALQLLDWRRQYFPRGGFF
jgi:hypothetical protein